MPNEAIMAPSDRQSTALQKVFDTVPREEIISALLDSGDPKAVQLAERLQDSKHSRTNLARHCYDLKMLPKDVWNILIDSRKLEARLKLSEALAGIVTAVAEAAVPQIITCPKCRGVGVMVGKKKKGEEEPPEITCPMCDGLQRIVRPPDRESQKMALEMGELLNQKVPLIAQQFNSFKGGGQQGDVGAPDMADWSRNTDSVFEERRSDAVEGEIVGG